MTPRDSGETICRACRDGDHDNCVIANYRYTQPGPGCACPCPIEQLDSGETIQHECQCGYRIVGRDAEGPHTWSRCKPDSGEREVCLNPNCEVCAVSLPHDLAQRILAALEKYAESQPLEHLLADELRAIVERKT